MNPSDPQAFELRFRPLSHQGSTLAFPCDSRGQVDLDALSERVKTSYFYARTVIGREFARPMVTGARVRQQ
jgi:hypothetical protein